MNFERDYLTERLFGKELENSGRTPAKAYLQKIAANLKAQQGADLEKERSGQGERMGLCLPKAIRHSFVINDL